MNWKYISITAVALLSMLLAGCGEQAASTTTQLVTTTTMESTTTEDSTTTTEETTATTQKSTTKKKTTTTEETTTTTQKSTTKKKTTTTRKPTTKKKTTTTAEETTTTAEETTTTRKATSTTEKTTSSRKTVATRTTKTTTTAQKRTTTRRTTTTEETTTTTEKPTTTTKAPTTTTAKPKTYGVGETWVVEDQWEFTVNSVKTHKLCNNSWNNSKGYTDEQVVIINYTYKNLGYTGTYQDLYLTSSAFEVYDESGEAAEAYACTHEKNAKVCIVGAKCTAEEAYVLFNDSSEITLVVEQYTSNDTGRAKATFKLSVEESSEEEMGGSTFTLDATLPETFFYQRDGKTMSRCTVEEVTFEVSGKTLDIYFSGKKTYDSQGNNFTAPCYVSWKLYDEDNNVIKTGTMKTDVGLAVGEGYRKQKSSAYDCIEGGKNYRLVLLNTSGSATDDWF